MFGLKSALLALSFHWNLFLLLCCDLPVFCWVSMHSFGIYFISSNGFLAIFLKERFLMVAIELTT